MKMLQRVEVCTAKRSTHLSSAVCVVTLRGFAYGRLKLKRPSLAQISKRHRTDGMKLLLCNCHHTFSVNSVIAFVNFINSVCPFTAIEYSPEESRAWN